MIERLTEIAPLWEWAVLAGSTGAFVCAFVTLSHALLVRRAYEARFRGVAEPTALETMCRWTVIFAAAGFALWALLLGWPPLVPVLVSAVGAAALGVEVAVRAIG